MKRTALIALALFSTGAHAQTADAGDPQLPDASVGGGGADRDSPEGDDGTGRTPTACRSAADCERGFTCEAGRCVFVGYREANRGGCLLGSSASMLAVAASLAWARRYRRRRSE